MGKSKKVTIGYKYYMGIHAGLARGPVDEIVEIRVGDKKAWSGSITDNAEIAIDKPDLFGGEEKEGGIKGTLAVLMGGRTQPIHSGLAAMLGGLVPAFRGVATTFFDGLVCAMSPYPKAWAYRVRRGLTGWQEDAVWYPSKAIITMADGAIKAMNPAHILYQVYTDKLMGRGLPAGRLDDASWAAAADRLYQEGFGLCLKWARQDGVDAFAQVVLDHIGGAVYTDRNTGLITLSLIRDGYDPSALPTFGPDTGLLAIDDDEASSAMKGTNEVIVTFMDPVAKEERSVRAKNTAAIHSAGGAVSTVSKDFSGIPTASLALRVAHRELQAASGYLKRFKVRLDRRGGTIVPAGLFRISDPSRGLSNIVLRAGRVEYGTTTNGTITVTAVQDMFGLPTTVFEAPDPSGYIPPSTAPAPATLQRCMEVPYRELAQLVGSAESQAQDALAGFLFAMASAPTVMSQSFDLVTRVGSSGAYTKRDDGAWCPTAVLLDSMTRQATSAVLGSGVDLDDVQVGTAALIDDEIVRVDSINPSTGAITVARGCIDTVPAPHASGARVWFYDGFGGIDSTEYTSGLTVYAKLLTRTPSGALAESAASAMSVLFSGRAGKPYPPGAFKINGGWWPATVSGDITIAWAHRDRIIQADQLIGFTAGSIGPEPGVLYRLRIYGNGTLRRTVSDLSVSSFTYTAAMEAADGGPWATVRIILDSVRSGIYSAQVHDWTVSRI